MLNIMISIDSLINDYLLEAWCGPLIHLHCFSFLDVLSVLFTPVGRAGLPVFDCPLDADLGVCFLVGFASPHRALFLDARLGVCFVDVLSVLFTPVGRSGLPVFDCPLDADSALRLLPTVPVFLVPVPLDVSFLIAIIKGVLLFIYFNV